VRGGASAAFIAGAVGAGQVVAATSLGGLVWMNGTLLALAAVDGALATPKYAGSAPGATAGQCQRLACGAWLLASYGAGGLGYEQPRAARWLRSVALGGRRHRAGRGRAIVFRGGPGRGGRFRRGRPDAAAVAWPAGAAALAASAGIVRWSVTAVTAWLPAMALVEPLHGLTFALLHLACMQMLSVVVPPALAATAQGTYGGVAVGTMTAVMTLVSAHFTVLSDRKHSVMALLCAAALPIAFAMRGISINAFGPIRSSRRLTASRNALKRILNGGFDRKLLGPFEPWPRTCRLPRKGEGCLSVEVRDRRRGRRAQDAPRCQGHLNKPGLSRPGQQKR
jgi:MFS transporter, PPP family, 3-phenylpropionic acid transporter